nr:MAG TPA: hypothetical protein [Caudoviricetes sp.]
MYSLLISFIITKFQFITTIIAYFLLLVSNYLK